MNSRFITITYRYTIRAELVCDLLVSASVLYMYILVSYMYIMHVLKKDTALRYMIHFYPNWIR